MKQTILAFVSLLSIASAVGATDVQVFRHRSVFLPNSDFQLNQGGWIKTLVPQKELLGYRVDISIFYESSQSEDSKRILPELNLAFGPVWELGREHGRLQLVFPVGLRLRHEEGWQLSHLITKVNLYRHKGKYPFFSINNLSWGRGEEPDQRFHRAHFARHPKERRFGFGVETDLVIVGSREVWTAGGVLRIRYHQSENDERKWKHRIDVYLFQHMTTGGFGVKLDFRNLRFGK